MLWNGPQKTLPSQHGLHQLLHCRPSARSESHGESSGFRLARFLGRLGLGTLAAPGGLGRPNLVGDVAHQLLDGLTLAASASRSTCGSGAQTQIFDAAGNIVTSTDPTGATTTSCYLGDTTCAPHTAVGPDGLLYQTRSPSGTKTTDTYDTSGHLVMQVTSYNSYSATTAYSYDPAGHQVCTVGPKEYATGVRCPTTTPTPAHPTAGASTTYYNTTGQVIETIGPTGATSLTAYDPVGQEYCSVAPTAAAKGVTCRPFSTLVTPIAGTDPEVGATITLHNVLGEVTTQASPLGAVTTSHYNTRGQVRPKPLRQGQQLAYHQLPPPRPTTQLVGLPLRRPVAMPPTRHTTRQALFTAPCPPWRMRQGVGALHGIAHGWRHLHRLPPRQQVCRSRFPMPTGTPLSRPPQIKAPPSPPTTRQVGLTARSPLTISPTGWSQTPGGVTRSSARPCRRRVHPLAQRTATRRPSTRLAARCFRPPLPQVSRRQTPTTPPASRKR